MQNFSQSKNKFGYVYILTPKGISEKAALTSDFLKRKLSEYESLKLEIESLNLDLQSKHEHKDVKAWLTSHQSFFAAVLAHVYGPYPARVFPSSF